MSASSPNSLTEAEASTNNWWPAVTEACGRIAPTWPLDQINAVNPFWEMRDLPFARVAARMAALNGTCCLGAKALEQVNGQASPEPTVNLPEHWQNLSAQLDRHRDTAHQIGWRDEIVQQISQFCGDYFQRLDAGDFKPSPQHLYQSWLDTTRADRGMAIVMGEPDLPSRFRTLPDQFETLISDGFNTLAPEPQHSTDYAHALLLDINGWSSWAAYLRWQARLSGDDTDLLPGLLAVRLAWELALWEQVEQIGGSLLNELKQRWQHQWEAWPSILETHQESQVNALRQQVEAESAYQEQLARQLLATSGEDPATRQTPKLQAAFCIDVRSEVFRRALEAQDPGIQTLGFAGFFGLPIAYHPKGTGLQRPQLPGLLAPSLEVTEKQPSKGFKRQALANHSHWARFAGAVPASFSVIETLGIATMGRLAKKTFLGDEAKHPVNRLHEGQTQFEIRREGNLLETHEKAELVEGILRAMSFTHDFAPTVLLVGHGSSTRNNPHAAGLDCGACGGQTGSVNVRVLAELLNDADVRSLLAGKGIEIPTGTRFIGALHDTTTDEVRCASPVPEEIQGFLREAGARARRERALQLGIHDTANVDKSIRRRSRDWSEVRPEWGLAGNASFIVAPRSRTRHLDLKGRTFLHDYRWQEDEGFGVLEQVMTAPMLVTHWINFQYFASVTDNLHYGSGNKVLHNVVGGRIGVFEGNGGDLRIGLPLQSLHDGQRWVHEPLRLSVYISAPRDAIADIVRKHEVVRELVDNDWLYLFRINDDSGAIERFYQNRWDTTVDRASLPASDATHSIRGENQRVHTP